jgi:hypothetical protein
LQPHQIQRLHPTARNRGFLVGPADRTRMVRRLGPVENDAGEAFATTSIIINECHPFSSPPFGLGVMVEVLTSCTHRYFCPNLLLTTILLQSHSCSTARRQHLPSRPFVSTLPRIRMSSDHPLLCHLSQSSNASREVVEVT